MENIKTMESKIGDKYNLIRVTKLDVEIIMSLKEWGKGSDECSHFNSLWDRFKNWDNNNAFVYILLDKDKIIGMNAFTCNKRNPYVNCYYFEVDGGYRNLGLGKKLFWSCIEKGKSLGNTRLTLRTKTNSIGMGFYNAIGMKERFFDPISKENIFDFSIEFLENIEEIKEFGEVLNDTPHKSRLKIYGNYEKI